MCLPPPHQDHRVVMMFEKSSQLVNFVLRAWKLRWWAKLHLTASSASIPLATSAAIALGHVILLDELYILCVRVSVCVPLYSYV